MKDYDEVIEKMLEAIIFCMDYPMANITDDDEYSDAVDLQNDLKNALNELKMNG